MVSDKYPKLLDYISYFEHEHLNFCTWHQISQMNDDEIELGYGWIDAWRILHPDERDFTWWSNTRARNGFRLDYAFLSSSLSKRLLNASHSHHERKQGYSDHSIQIFDIVDDN